MSRQIDPLHITPDDVEYIRQRPFLRQEFEMQGYGDPLAENYPHLVNEDGESVNPGGQSDDRDVRIADLTKQVEDLEAEVANLREKEAAAVQKGAPVEPSTQPETESAEPFDLDDLPEDQKWNSDMTKAELQAVIVARNATYEPDEQIAPSGDKNAELIEALREDDAELVGDSDSDS